MSKLKLSLAIGEYTHTHDLVSGKVRPEGIELVTMDLPIEAIAPRFNAHLEFDVAEYSFGAYCAHIASATKPRMIALPVFTSRTFRHGAIYINANSTVKGPGDLAGRRVGIPQWVQTAVVYVRGFLQHDCGVPLASVTWVQAGLDEPGRVDIGNFVVPEGVMIERRPRDTLGDMLISGDVDAIITARPPRAFLEGDKRIVRLFADPRIEEEAYFARTGIFPIMHVIALRQELYESNRWIARNLFDAFQASKAAAVKRLANTQVSYLPVAWGPSSFGRTSSMLFSGDPWPYGLPDNRVTIESFLRFCHEQGVAGRSLRPEELFAPETSLQIHI